MKKLILFASLLLSLKGFSQDNNRIQKQYQNKISFSYPSSWEYKDGGDILAFFIFSPVENSADRFRENINLIIDSAEKSKEIDLRSYVDSSLMFLSNNLREFQLDSSRQTMMHGQVAHDVYYSGYIPQHPNKLVWIQRYFEADKVKYVLTYTAEADKPDPFRNTANDFLSSLRFQKQ